MKTKLNTKSKQSKSIHYFVFCSAVLTSLLFAAFSSSAQNVAVTDDSLYTPNASAVLDIKSTSKGILIPRVSLTGTSSASPITTPATSLMVYNEATVSDVTPGYYYWDGTQWIKLESTARVQPVFKNTSVILTKAEELVMASNDITVTLPQITNADNGLEITIKNVGTYTDLVIVQGYSGATIDATTTANLYRWQSKSFIANNGNWVLEDYEEVSENLYEVSPKGSWTSIPEIIAFLNEHMNAPAMIRLGSESYAIASTQVIDLPYPITFQGMSFGHTTIAAATGLANLPMFRCVSECYFKMLMFDATTLPSYGTLAGEDAIRLVGSGTYHEIKDCTFDGFYNTILDSSDAELWLFECDISNAHNNGILIHSNVPGTKVRVAETDFISCVKGINFDKATNAEIQLSSGSYLNANATDTAIKYNPTDFSFTEIQITGNMFNNVGKFIKGFDFTRSDGRDANAYIESNAGYETKRPHCKMNVLNNVATTTVATAGTWVKANWTNTSQYLCKFSMSNNRITYQSTQTYDGLMTISGNVICNNDAKILSLAIIKNGNYADRYGETSVKIMNSGSNYPHQFSTNVYLEDMSQGDYYELWITSSSNSDVYKIQDLQWYTITQ